MMFGFSFIIFLTVLCFQHSSSSLCARSDVSLSRKDLESSLDVLGLLAHKNASLCFWTEDNDKKAKEALDLINNLIIEVEHEKISQDNFRAFIMDVRSTNDQIIPDLKTFNDMDIARFGCLRKLYPSSVLEEQIQHLTNQLVQRVSHNELLRILCTAEKRFERTLSEIRWDSDKLKSIKVKTLILMVGIGNNEGNPISQVETFLEPILSNSILCAPSISASDRISLKQSTATCLWNHGPSKWATTEFKNSASALLQFMIESIDIDLSLRVSARVCELLSGIIRQYEPLASDYELYTICSYGFYLQGMVFRDFTDDLIDINSLRDMVDDLLVVVAQSCRFSLVDTRDRVNFYVSKFILGKEPVQFSKNTLLQILRYEKRIGKYISIFNDAENMAKFEKMVEIRRELNIPTFETFTLVKPWDFDATLIRKLEIMQIRCIEQRN